MSSFGETIRDLRVAQSLGLREAAGLVGISPAYLSRIERGKESPPRPEVIKALAKVLAADPDVLFRPQRTSQSCWSLPSRCLALPSRELGRRPAAGGPSG